MNVIVIPTRRQDVTKSIVTGPQQSGRGGWDYPHSWDGTQLWLEARHQWLWLSSKSLHHGAL